VVGSNVSDAVGALGEVVTSSTSRASADPGPPTSTADGSGGSTSQPAVRCSDGQLVTISADCPASQLSSILGG
jgi:hypothetical protein